MDGERACPRSFQHTLFRFKIIRAASIGLKGASIHSIKPMDASQTCEKAALRLSIHTVCEHFEPVLAGADGLWRIYRSALNMISALTHRAIKTAPLGLGDVFNRRAADMARLAAAAVHVQGLLEITRTALRADKVTQGGAALCD